VAAVASQGTCLEVGYPHRIRCFLGELSGTAPGNSATVALTFTAGASGVVSYSVSGVAGGFDPNPGDNAETETTRVGVLGGETLRIQTAAGGGASLEWRSGDIQAGYFVGRRAGGATTILPSGGVPLPAAATSFTDPAPAGGQNNCYVVAPVDGGGAAMARSDMLCLIPGTASPSGVPPNFRLELRQSPTARLTWSHPGGQSWYIVAIYPQGGGAPSSETLPGTRNTAQYNTGGVPTCYVLYAGTGTTEIGHTDALCAVPGVSTLRK
jgi:hypothetical protein